MLEGIENKDMYTYIPAIVEDIVERQNHVLLPGMDLCEVFRKLILGLILFIRLYSRITLYFILKNSI